MRKQKSGKGSPVDPAAAHIVVAFYPYAGDTAASVALVRGLGGNARSLRVWSGHLACKRSDLAGLRAADIAERLCGDLAMHLAGYNRSALPPGTDTSRAASSGPPGGLQGEAWTQPSLPVDLEYTSTPPRIAQG